MFNQIKEFLFNVIYFVRYYFLHTHSMIYCMCVSALYSSILGIELLYYYMWCFILNIAESFSITLPTLLLNHILYMRYVCDYTWARLTQGLILLQNIMFGRPLINNNLLLAFIFLLGGSLIADNCEMFLSELNYLYDIWIYPFLTEIFSKKATSIQLDLEFKDCLIGHLDKYNSPEEVLSAHRWCVHKINNKYF